MSEATSSLADLQAKQTAHFAVLAAIVRLLGHDPQTREMLDAAFRGMLDVAKSVGAEYPDRRDWSDAFTAEIQQLEQSLGIDRSLPGLPG